eukprot:4157337-Ditylum_brightwellii.AAC.1
MFKTSIIKYAEEPATFVENFSNKGKRKKLVAKLTIGGMGGHIRDESRDEKDFFAKGDDFVQTGTEATEANDPAVSSS